MDKARQLNVSDCSALLCYLKKFDETSLLVTGQLLHDWQRGTIEDCWWVDKWPEPQVIVSFRGGVRSNLLVFSCDLETAFQILSQIQLHPGFVFFAVPDNVVPAIEKVASAQNYSLKYETCYTYVLGETVVNTQDESWLEKRGFQLDRLNVEDSVKVNKFWPYADHNSNRTLDYISYIIENFPSVCIRKVCGPSEVSSDVLVGWVLCNEYGAIGMLHVLEEYRRQGFAKRMVSKLTVDLLQWQQIHQAGIERPPPFSFVVTTNFGSQRVFEACGFKRRGLVHWIIVQNPTTNNKNSR